MAVVPFVSGKFYGTDANGLPLSGGLLYTYAAGTTTPQATYTDASGTVANANPVVLDSAGRADVWLLSGTSYKFVLQNSLGVVQYTEDNWAAGSSGGSSGSGNEGVEPGGRLSLTVGTPVTTADVTGATTIYYSPYKHDLVPIWSGSAWTLQSIGTGIQQTTTDATKSPAAVVASSCYDLFVWNDSGTIRLSRGAPWTSTTARGTGAGTTQLTQLNGRWVNQFAITNGPGANLGTYVGTIYTDGNSQVNDSATLRHVWNMQNRTRRKMIRTETAATWTYAANTFRQANANPLNQLDMVRGMNEDMAWAQVDCFCTISTPPVSEPAIAISLDGAAPGADMVGGTSQPPCILHAAYNGYPGLGRHTLIWWEASDFAADTTTFGGGSGSTWAKSIHGEVMA